MDGDENKMRVCVCLILNPGHGMTTGNSTFFSRGDSVAQGASRKLGSSINMQGNT